MPIEDLLSYGTGRGIGSESTLGKIGVDNDVDAAAAPFLGAKPSPVFGHKTLESGDQESAQTAFVAIDIQEPLVLEQSTKELLGDVLSVVGRLAAAPGVSVKGVPVSATESLHRAE